MNEVKMSINAWKDYQSDEDFQFAFCSIDFLTSTKKVRNSHNHYYSEEIIKKYAPSILGKWVTASYDKFNNDARSHNNDQIIIGIIPESQEIKYWYNEYGELVATVNAVISKLYAQPMYEVIKRDGVKSVSIEELVNFSEETAYLPDGGVNPKIITEFEITAVTVLGNQISPSVKGANISLIKMSEDSFIEDCNKSYVKYTTKNSVWSCKSQNPYT